MTLPKHIKDELEAAEEAFKQANPEQGEAEANEAATGQTAEHEETTQQPEPVQDAQPEPENTVDFEHKYNVLKGKYNSENAAMREKISHLESQLANTNQGSQAEQDKLMEALREEYGSEHVDGIVNDLEQDKPQEDSPPDDNMQQRLAAIEEREAQLSQEQGMAKLDNLIPNWRETDSDPLFHAWLSEADNFSGQPRQTLLTQAFQDGDYERVHTIFNAFSGANTAQPLQQSEPQQPQRRVIPDGITATPQGEAQQVYTRQQVDQLYQDIRKGKYRHDEAGRDALERDIFTAQGEGRII